MRKTLRASALLLALCCPVFAGDMGCPPVVTPPPPALQQTATGDMPTPSAALIDALLSLLAIALP